MEQSGTPWRVFDAPGNGENGTGEQGAASAAAAAKPAAGMSATGMPPAWLAIAAVAGAVAIGIVAVVVAMSGSGGQVVEAPDKVLPRASSGTAMLAGAGEVVVDVTGAVVKPGVYHLPPGSRVGDAIDAAGGFSPRVDADKVAAALNLAATLTDGSQVHVPSRDEPVAATGSGGSGGSDSGGAGGASTVNLNTASQSELEGLPGIGPVTATKIIESRTAQPFTSIEELRERKLVGEKTFDQLKSLVTVG